MLLQQPPILHEGRTDPSAAGYDRGRRNPSLKLSLDSHAILNDDKGITMVKQGAKNVWSRYQIREGPVLKAVNVPRVGGESCETLAHLNVQTIKRYCRSAASLTDATTGSREMGGSVHVKPAVATETDLWMVATPCASQGHRSRYSTRDLRSQRFQSVNPGAALTPSPDAPLKLRKQTFDRSVVRSEEIRSGTRLVSDRGARCSPADGRHLRQARSFQRKRVK